MIKMSFELMRSWGEGIKDEIDDDVSRRKIMSWEDGGRIKDEKV